MQNRENNLNQIDLFIRLNQGLLEGDVSGVDVVAIKETIDRLLDKRLELMKKKVVKEEKQPIWMEGITITQVYFVGYLNKENNVMNAMTLKDLDNMQWQDFENPAAMEALRIALKEMDNYNRLIKELAELLGVGEEEKIIKYAIKVLQKDAERFDKLVKELETWRMRLEGQSQGW